MHPRPAPLSSITPHRHPGVYTLHDLRAFGRKKGWCPYFLARHMMAFSNVIVYNYQYMLDPKVSQVSAAAEGGGVAEGVGGWVVDFLSAVSIYLTQPQPTTTNAPPLHPQPDGVP